MSEQIIKAWLIFGASTKKLKILFYFLEIHFMKLIFF